MKGVQELQKGKLNPGTPVTPDFSFYTSTVFPRCECSTAAGPEFRLGSRDSGLTIRMDKLPTPKVEPCRKL